MTTTGPVPIPRPVPARTAPTLPKLQRSPWLRGWAAAAAATGLVPLGLLIAAAVIL